MKSATEETITLLPKQTGSGSEWDGAVCPILAIQLQATFKHLRLQHSSSRIIAALEKLHKKSE